MPIENSAVTGLPDGIYEGSFNGGGGIYEVKVEVQHGMMMTIESFNDRRSKYEKYSRPVLDRIIEEQNANVDGITGATTTSKCLMKAVEDALKQE